MSVTPEVLAWIASGIILIILEFFLPGLVSVFLGAAAVLVGLLIHFHLIQGWIQALGVWFFLSIFLVLTVRRLAGKFFLSDSEYKYTEEDDDAIGKIVEVVETIHNGDSPGSQGRIRFQGTDWPARTLKGVIRKGSHAIIKYRDNISWVVEACDEKISKGVNKKGN